jgi:hypothetical protein
MGRFALTVDDVIVALSHAHAAAELPSVVAK